MQYQGYLITDTKLRAGGITRTGPRWYMLKTSTTQSSFPPNSLSALWDYLYCQYMLKVCGVLDDQGWALEYVAGCFRKTKSQKPSTL